MLGNLQGQPRHKWRLLSSYRCLYLLLNCWLSAPSHAVCSPSTPLHCPPTFPSPPTISPLFGQSLPSTPHAACIAHRYPTTVATLSRRARDRIEVAFEQSVQGGASNPLLSSRLHDFGFRGCTCLEQSVLGGVAHLLNFDGSDTLSAAYYAQVKQHLQQHNVLSPELW